MRAERTDWDMHEYEAEDTFGKPTLVYGDPPSVGIGLSWGTKWWKPALIINVCRWRLSIGWLIE